MSVAGNDHEPIPPRPGRHRRRVLVALGAVIVTVVAGGCVLALRTSDDAEPDQSAGCALVVQVFLDRDIGEDARGAVEFMIRHIPNVGSYSFQDQDGALAEAERIFADDPGSLERVRREPEILPTSFRVVPDTTDLEALTAMTGTLVALDGVLNVSWEMADVDMPSWSSVGDPEIVVFLQQDLSEEDRVTAEQAIAADVGVAGHRSVDGSESLAEFERLFARNQEMLDRVHEDPEHLPTPYRLVPATEDPDDHAATATRLAEVPGVLRAVATADAIEDTERSLANLNCG